MQLIIKRLYSMIRSLIYSLNKWHRLKCRGLSRFPIQAISESFSIGLSILQSGILQNMISLYSGLKQDKNLKDTQNTNGFNQQLLQKYLNQWMNLSFHSSEKNREFKYRDPLKFAILGMCSPNPQNRYSSKQIYEVLRPHEVIYIVFQSECPISKNKTVDIEKRLNAKKTVLANKLDQDIKKETHPSLVHQSLVISLNSSKRKSSAASKIASIFTDVFRILLKFKISQAKQSPQAFASLNINPIKCNTLSAKLQCQILSSQNYQFQWGSKLIEKFRTKKQVKKYWVKYLQIINRMKMTTKKISKASWVLLIVESLSIIALLALLINKNVSRLQILNPNKKIQNNNKSTILVTRVRANVIWGDFETFIALMPKKKDSQIICNIIFLKERHMFWDSKIGQKANLDRQRINFLKMYLRKQMNNQSKTQFPLDPSLKILCKSSERLIYLAQDGQIINEQQAEGK